MTCDEEYSLAIAKENLVSMPAALLAPLMKRLGSPFEGHS
jgi:hypothetical protein